MNWGYYDNSTIIQTQFIHDSTLWQEVHGNNKIILKNSSAKFTFMNNSNASLISDDADYVQIEMSLTKSGSPYSFTLPNNKSSVNWQSPDKLPYNIKLINADVSSVDFNFFDGIEVTINSSNNVKFGWLFGLHDSSNGGYSDSISGLKKQLYSDSTFTSGSGSRLASIRLVNSSLHNWWPTVYTNPP